MVKAPWLLVRWVLIDSSCQVFLAVTVPLLRLQPRLDLSLCPKCWRLCLRGKL